MKLAALLSGGKDSIYALYLASKKHKIKYAIAFISENPESYMLHVPNIKIAEEQARQMDITFLEKKTTGIKEDELKDIKDMLRKVADDVEGIVCGAIESNYQKNRIERICNELGLELVAPLWHKEQKKLLDEMLDEGFRIIITAVAAPPLDRKWLGKIINKQVVKELKELNNEYGISIAGEGGEIETLVLNCPLFKKKIRLLDSEQHWDCKTQSGWLEIKRIELVKKG